MPKPTKREEFEEMAAGVSGISHSQYMDESIETVREQQQNMPYWDGKLMDVVIKKMGAISAFLKEHGQ